MSALQPHPTLSTKNQSAALGTLSDDALFASGPSEYETLSGVLRVLRRRWRTVVLVTLGIFLLGLLVCLIMTPKYASTAIIEINKEDNSANVSTDTGTASPTADELKAEIETDISVLQSDGLALAVIRDLNLTHTRPFSGDIVSSEKDKPLDQAPLTREKLIKRFAKNLTVESPPDTRLITVTFLNPDPAVAANVANAISQKFIDSAMDRRHKSTIQSSYWLRKELDDLKKQVEDSEQKLADYQRESGLAGVQISANGGGGDNAGGAAGISPHSTVTDRLYTLNQELTAAESNRISTETVFHLVQSQDPEVVLGLGSMSASGGNGGGSLTPDGGIQLIRSLRTEEAALEQEYAGAAVKYGANNPRLAQTQQQLDAVKQQLHAELQRISKRAENSYLYAKQNEDTIRQQFVKQQSNANEMADATVHLQVLAQEAYSNRALYESLFSKLQTANLASGVRATRIDIADQARPAGTPAIPNYLKYLSLIAGVGIFFGISSAFLRESLDETVRRPRDLQRIAGLRMLGYVPRMQTKSLLASSGGDSKLIDAPKAPFSEAFRVIRTSIMRALPSIGSRTLLVTSAAGRDGKTTAVYNLGVAFAQQGARVLLLDCDLRNPDLHRLFGCALSPGVSDLQDPVTKAEVLGIVRHTSLSNLFMLPAGPPPEFPAEFFESQTFDALLRVCAADYDYVLIDSPPILSVTDTSIIASKVGGSIAVVRSRSTTQSVLSSLIESLHHANTPVLGVVLNDVRNPENDGFHGYSYSRQEEGPIHAGI
ncbi:GumC family protein [Tunturibacter empetritectus]|uniref:non-specific protein-tyrosine kinase n=1 Tax=Tunturiibacter empetritectus TaxID=3069691 RepID=A0A7W8IEB1_9BACT|nr:polysaccharide biosynthesis tyrosine autokinase [Edaphobacter lichenicola]MBB5315603.1 capsular exopolysaccharide synthesis family protein [Edaphobacter lichenicola]